MVIQQLTLTVERYLLRIVLYVDQCVRVAIHLQKRYIDRPTACHSYKHFYRRYHNVYVYIRSQTKTRQSICAIEHLLSPLSCNGAGWWSKFSIRFTMFYLVRFTVIAPQNAMQW